MELFVQNHVSFDRKICAGDDLIVIDSFDGAEHSKSNKNRTSLISFSSQMFTPSMINSGAITAGSSLNILTWQQMRATESYNTMMPAANDYFKRYLNFDDDIMTTCILLTFWNQLLNTNFRIVNLKCRQEGVGWKRLQK